MSSTAQISEKGTPARTTGAGGVNAPGIQILPPEKPRNFGRKLAVYEYIAARRKLAGARHVPMMADYFRIEARRARKTWFYGTGRAGFPGLFQ